jgi:hypothetical protein
MTKLSLVAFAAMVVTAGAAQARCSNATIQGDWAFTVHGNLLTPPDGAISIARVDGVGIITFDGFGNLRQQDFIVANGVHPDPKEFHKGQSGNYQIGADCTGFAHIDFPADQSSLELALVISKTARSIHTVVFDGVPAGVLRQVYSDLEKVDLPQQ